MKPILREYGVAIVLITVGVAGYLLYYHNRDDILASSLDVIGDRLVEMVNDPASKQFIAERFAEFKQQVIKHEVSPEQVENVAANVFNLSSSGSTLTSEQAELVLEFATAPEIAALPAPNVEVRVETAPEAPKPPAVLQAPTPARPAPGDMEALGERLHAMVVLEREVKAAMKQVPAHSKMLAEHMRFQFKDGLHVSVDTSLMQALDREAFEELAREFKKLEKKRLVVWRANIAAERQAERARVQRELASVQALQQRPKPPAPEAVQEGMKALESLKHLEMMGLQTPFSSDSLRSLLKEQMRVAISLQHERSEARREALEDYMDDLEAWIEEAVEAQEDALEAQQEALEAELEARQEGRSVVRVQQQKEEARH